MDEGEERPGGAAVGRTLDDDGASRVRVEESGCRNKHVGRQIPDRHVRTQVADEPRLLAEGQFADVGVDAVGTDHHVEGLGSAVAEGDIDTGVGLDHRGDRVTEDVRNPIST